MKIKEKITPLSIEKKTPLYRIEYKGVFYFVIYPKYYQKEV